MKASPPNPVLVGSVTFSAAAVATAASAALPPFIRISSPACDASGWLEATSRDLSPNASGGLTPLSPPSELQEIPVATREQSRVLCFHSRWMPVSPGVSGMQPRDPFRPWRGTLASGHKPRRSEEHTSELQSPTNLVCRLLLEKKKKKI